jgi:hypothetical protein
LLSTDPTTATSPFGSVPAALIESSPSKLVPETIWGEGQASVPSPANFMRNPFVAPLAARVDPATATPPSGTSVMALTRSSEPRTSTTRVQSTFLLGARPSIFMITMSLPVLTFPIVPATKTNPPESTATAVAPALVPTSAVPSTM